MSATTLQRLHVASLIGECEAIAASGRLTEPSEKSLRLLIASTLAAFGMPSLPERAANNNRAPDADLHSIFDPDYAELLEIMRQQMGATS